MVDWVPSRPERPEGLIVVYDGGVLAPGEVAAITLPDGELAGYEFVEPGIQDPSSFLTGTRC